MNTFQLKIVASNKVFFDGECVQLVLPIADGGLMGFLAHHENVVAPIEIGEMKIDTPDGKSVRAFISDGFVEFSDNYALVVCISAEYPQEIDRMRAEEAKRLLAEGHTTDELRRNDMARQVIIPRMIETMRQQNISYSVIDGFPIPMQHVRIITLDFRPWEIALASDGYPFLCPTLEESERRLRQQSEDDPLNIGTFQATKAFHPDNNSFDDRSYIRFRV